VIHSLRWTRRGVLGLPLALLALSGTGRAQGQAIDVYRDPLCGCCEGWVDHLKGAGYAVAVVERSDVTPLKKQLTIPEELWACHTGTIAGYAIEGHVPAHALGRLLTERPPFKGLAVPGMPIGSPGMEGDREDLYEVIGFGGGGRPAVFGRYRGDRPV